ncbi:MAG: hypothetical protein H7Y61_01340 [Rhizobiales bacterium]|nr:hypothetical protein [Rhizobacter sp.]
MKLQPCIASLLLAVAGIASAAVDPHKAGDDHKPKHGGVVTATAALDYELVAKPALIQLYLSDHGKPSEVSKASAKLTLLAGAEKQEVELKPVGDKLEAAGSFKVGPGTKAVVVLTRAGKPTSTARFTLK